jgi:dUTP pyrophosphatase
MPVKGSSQATGHDISSDQEVILGIGQALVVSTGISIDLSLAPRDLDVQIRSRSGLAANHDVFVLNSPGTIDRDYQGEIKVILMNLGTTPFHIHKGMRIAQMVLGVVSPVMLVGKESDGIKGFTTERGEGGLGSTGM